MLFMVFTFTHAEGFARSEGGAIGCSSREFRGSQRDDGGRLVRHGRAGFDRDAANLAGAEIMEL